MKALALKELRELRGIAVIALGIYLILVARMMGLKAFDWAPGLPQEQEFPPFSGGEFLSIFALLAAVFAMALGFRQSAWEASQGTFLFLLHRPISRRGIFLTKLAVGGLIYLACSSLPILLYGWWAATPGNHASPFRWSWTIPSFSMMGLFLLIYLSAFLSGIRPAKWFGTRLLPLFATLLLITLVLNPSSFDIAHLGQPMVIGITIACAALAMVFIGLICFVAQNRDYA
jgi:ABC-type transport system involved in multi-copper enzyme maturation permease subunit